MRWSASLTAGATALVGSLAASVALPAAPALPLAPAPVAAAAAPVVPPAARPDLAFTDDRDELATRVVRPTTTQGTRAHDVSGPTGLHPQPAVHRAEASAVPGAHVFVSTAPDDARGEVYVVRDGDPAPVRVTCANAAVETHPVLSPDGDSVAWASDAGSGTDLWVATLQDVVPTSSPTGPSTQPCPTARRVTTSAAQDHWPAWLPDGASLVFASTRQDPLGDLYTVRVPTVQSPSPEQVLTRLTSGPAAESQPTTSLSVDNDVMVLFTTTQYRSDGSLARLTLGGGASPPPDDELGRVEPLWQDPADPLRPAAGTPQSSEPDVAPDGSEVLFTSTRDDPYGDVLLSPLEDRAVGPLGLHPRDPVPVADVPGQAESHGTWLAGYVAGTEPRATVAYTRRALAADVSAVVAADGTDRRVLAGTTRDDGDGGTVAEDDAGPSYAPDGRTVVFSRTTVAPGAEGPVDVRVLALADADGTGTRPLGYQRATYDVDVDPAWSPDGTQIAFTRYRYESAAGTRTASVWVVRVADGVTRRLSPTSAPGQQQFDLDPTWAPSGTRLAFTRRLVPRADAALDLTITPASTVTGAPATATARVTAVEAAADVRLLLHVPAAVTLLTLHPACERALGGVLCRTGPLATGASRDLTVRISSGSAGSHRLDGTVRASGHDPVPSNDVDSATLVVSVPPTPTPTVTVDLAGWRAGALPAQGAARAVPAAAAAGARAVAVPTLAEPQVWTMDAVAGADAAVLRQPDPRPVCQVTACPPVAVAGRSPAWSPDGRSIAVTRGPDLRVLTLRAAGAGVAVPEEAVADASLGTTAPLAGPLSVLEDPAWSPDGAELAFAGQPRGQPDQRGIYALRLATSSLRTVTQGRGPETEPAYQPYTDLAVTLTAAPTSVLQGTTSTLRLVLTNRGPGRVLDATGTVTLPAGLVRTGSLPAGCLAAGADVVCRPAAVLTSGASAGFDVPVRGTVPGAQQAVAVATSTTPDVAPANNRATATVTVVARPGTIRDADVSVTAELSAPRAWVGGRPVQATVTVRNAGPATALDVRLSTRRPPGTARSGGAPCLVDVVPCLLGPLGPGAQRQLVLTLTPTAAGSGALLATVTTSSPDPVPANDTARAELRVLQPRLRLLPAVAAPGKVVLAYGEDFPPADQVHLTWTVGIMTGPQPFPVAADGTVRQPVLVVRRDRLGARELTVTSDGGAFTPVTAPLLVVPRTMSPPEFVGRG